MKYLLISEKPSLMRLVQSAFYKAHMNFEVDFMSLHGHCCTLKDPGSYKEEWKTWNMDVLPMIPEKFEHVPVDEKLVKEIEKQLKDNHYDGFINCTDAEREGQNIFYSLYDYLGSSLPVKRFWASDLTDEKLIEAWKHLKDDQHDSYLSNLTKAALLRANADWLVGMNFSRMVSIMNGKAIPVGRVMTVVLAILAKREEEIKNFKPVTTYDVLVDYKEGFTGKLKHDSFAKKEDAEAVVESIGDTAIITDFEVKEKTSEAPLLYSLGDLQNDANKNFGYSLVDSLAIIQGLYEKKILSYPRTDCPYLTSGEGARMNLILAAARCVPEMLNYEIDERKIASYTKSKYVNDKKVQAHYAIVFTGREFKFDDLNDKEKNIVTLVAKRIVATLMDAAKTTEITVTAQEQDKTFITKESVLTYAGWKTLYGEQEKKISLKGLSKGQKLKIEKAYVKDVVSTCPKRFNDASINKAMINVGTLIEDEDLAKALEGKTKDQGGIGTPATRAGIVEKLLNPQKHWVERKNKSFYVTETGINVYHALKNYSVSSPVLTAEWEQKLKMVEDGEMESLDFENELNSYIKTECAKLKTAQVEGALKCPVCGSAIKESDKYFYCSKYKNPCTFIIGKKTGKANITEKDVKDLIEKGKTSSKNFTSKEGKKFTAFLKLEDGKVSYGFDSSTSAGGGADTDIKCSCGNSVKSLKGKFGKYYKCECGKTVSETQFAHKFTKNELKKLFAGDTILICGLKSKAGKVFNANLKITDNKVNIESFEKGGKV